MTDKPLFQVNPFDKRSPYKAQERARRRRLLIAISSGVIPALVPVAIAFGILMITSRTWQSITTFVLTGIMIFLIAITREQGKRDNIDLGGYTLLISLLILVGMNGILIDGLAPAVAPSYAVIVVMAGMMLGVIGGFTVAILAAILWLTAQLGVAAMILPPPLHMNVPLLYVTLVIVVVDFLFTAYMSYLSTEDLQQALDDTTYELVRVNRRLEEASAEVQRAKERVEAILDNSPDPILLLRGPDGGISTGNPSFYKMFGFTAAEMTEESLLHLIDPAYADDLRKALLNVISHPATITLQVIARKKDNQSFSADIALAPIKGGQLVKGIVCSIRDITERVQAEDKIRTALLENEAALSEREVLLKEIHHRVKNNLQVVSSLLKLQSSSIHDERVKLLFLDSQNRVQSMALIHEQLYQAADLARIDFNTYIHNLTSHLLASYAGETGKIELKIDAEEIYLPIDVAIPCGLLINEMISNAFKHAFPTQESGTISISFRSTPSDEIELTIKDDGIGFPSDLDFRHTRSLGMQLIQQLTRQLHGTVELNGTQGTCFQVRFRLSK
jgi:PAS domain S-box-containing protein